MNKLSDLTKLKIKILNEGLFFQPITLFSDILNEIDFKNKTIFKKPLSNGKSVYDESKRNEIIPSELILEKGKNRSIVKCRYNPDSTIQIKYEDNKLKIYENELPYNLNVKFVKDKEVLNKKIDDKFSVGDYVDIVGEDRISMLLFEGCYNWICGNQCKFCDLHPKRINEKVCRPTLNNLYKYKDIDEWWNTQKKIFFKNTNLSLKKILEKTNFEHNHIFIMAGNLNNSEKVWKFLLEFVENLSNQFDLSTFDTIVNVCPHDKIESIEKLKGFGIKQVQYNLEIANKEKFTYTCPGKIQYDTFINKLHEAVNIFGKGNVRSNFVLGLQDINELIYECEKFAKNGIVSDYSVFQPKKNTPYFSIQPPSMKDVIQFTDQLTDIYLKYNQKPIFCSMSSRSSIVNEVYYDKTNGNF